MGPRKRRSGKSLHDVLSDERSQASSASIGTSGGFPTPFPPIAPFNCHLPSTSSSLVPYTEIPQKNLPPSVHGGTFFAAANVNFYGTRKRRREEMSEGRCFNFARASAFLTVVRCAEETSPTQTADKRRRLEEEDGIKVCQPHALEATDLNTSADHSEGTLEADPRNRAGPWILASRWPQQKSRCHRQGLQ